MSQYAQVTQLIQLWTIIVSSAPQYMYTVDCFGACEDLPIHSRSRDSQITWFWSVGRLPDVPCLHWCNNVPSFDGKSNKTARYICNTYGYMLPEHSESLFLN